MKVKILTLGDLAVNCYLVSSAGAAIVIDPGFAGAETERFLSENREKERWILLTHSHFDHIGGVASLAQTTGVPIGIGEKDAPFLTDAYGNLSSLFESPVEPFSADRLLRDGEELTVGDLHITVMETPGHTPGSVCYRIGNFLFSGDTLFRDSVGRTDFPGGSLSALKASVKRLYFLSGDVTVYPGHGPATTVLHEREQNPYVR